MREHRSNAAVMELAETPDDTATPTVEVKPPDYRQLRLLAECAVGVEDQAVEFFFEDGTTLRRRAPQIPVADHDVLVATFDGGKFPRNLVELQAVTDAAGGYELPSGIADAVFWSDAAVQKFLFPYVTSCSGDNAGTVMQQVQQAWNFYPATQVTVYALVHVTSFLPEVALALEKSIWVVYTTQPASPAPPLSVLALDEFIGVYQGAQARQVGVNEVKYQRGVAGGEPQRPGYTQLRAMAEWAASLRDTTKYFVFRSGGDGFEVHDEIPELNAGDLVVPAHTPTVPAGRPVLNGVWFQPPEDPANGIVIPPANVANVGDALFWSTASIEQFLIPYYASKGGMESLDDLAEIARAWTEGGVDGTEVYALIHLPNSEWTEVIIEGETVKVEEELATIGSGQARRQVIRRLDPRHQIRVVTVDRKGSTRLVTIDRFKERHGLREG